MGSVDANRKAQPSLVDAVACTLPLIVISTSLGPQPGHLVDQVPVPFSNNNLFKIGSSSACHPQKSTLSTPPTSNP